MSKLIVFGARGAAGRLIVAEALQRGHDVTAVTRDAAAFEPAERLTVAEAEIVDPAGVAAIAAGHDAAVSAIGPRPGEDDAERHFVAAVATLVQGLARAGVPRLVVVGGAGSLLVDGSTRLVDTPDFHEAWKATALAHADVLAGLRSGDAPVDWAYMSPGAFFDAAGPRSGTYRLSGDDLLTTEEGASYLSYADGAIVVLDEIETPRHHRERFHAAA